MAKRTTKMVPIEIFVTADGLEFRSYEEAEHWDNVLKLAELVKASAPTEGTSEELAEWILSELEAITDISGDYEYIEKF